MFLPKLKKHKKGKNLAEFSKSIYTERKNYEKTGSKEETSPKSSWAIARLHEEPEASAESNAAGASWRKMLLRSLQWSTIFVLAQTTWSAIASLEAPSKESVMEQPLREL